LGYIDGFVTPVPSGYREQYRDAAQSSTISSTILARFAKSNDGPTTCPMERSQTSRRVDAKPGETND